LPVTDAQTRQRLTAIPRRVTHLKYAKVDATLWDLIGVRGALDRCAWRASYPMIAAGEAA
jgi:hypothetical protein